MKKTRAKKPSKEEVAAVVKQLLDVGFAGAILESVAEFVATGHSDSPLRAVIMDAEKRLLKEVWRKQFAEMR
jgi:hypothetical protein